MNLLCLIVIALSLLKDTLQQNVSMKAWVQDGYYYSHRCEVTLQIISTYFQSQYQLFHILNKQNAYFFNTVEYDSVFYIKGTNSMQQKMTSSQAYCRFPMSSTYFCPFISLKGYNPLAITYIQQYNSTHKKMTLRLGRSICPAEGLKMSYRIQMPIPSDYNDFYMYVSSLTDKAVLTVDKLGFVFDQQVEVDTSKLRYKQVDEITFMPAKYYLVNCKVAYNIKVKFLNTSYYQSFDQINIYISNPQSLSLSTQCTSTFSKPYTCSKTSSGYKLVNLNSANMVKSYEITEGEYYQNDPYVVDLSFGLQFLGQGNSTIEVVIKAYNNSIRESALNISFSGEEVYGRGIGQIRGFKEDSFVKLNQYALKYDPLKCITPIQINTGNTTTNSTTNNTTNSTTNSTTNNQTNNTSSNSTSNNSTTTNSTTNNSTSNNPYIPNNNTDNNFTFDNTSTNSAIELNQLVFITALIVTVVITLCLVQSMKMWQRLIYMLTILVISLAKMLSLAFNVDQSWLLSADTPQDSLVYNSTSSSLYSLEIFVVKNTFCLQLILNLFYFLTYLTLLMFSEQLKLRIKKLYNNKKKPSQQDNPQNPPSTKPSCTVYTVFFILITFLTFLFSSYKIYGIFIIKLQLNITQNSPQSLQFKKYRFKNPNLYKIHAGHLIIDLFLQTNALIWTFFIMKSCQNTFFLYFLYVFISLYFIHIYLMTVMLKNCWIMARSTQTLNQNDKEKIRQTSMFLNPCVQDQGCDNQKGFRNDQKVQEIQYQIKENESNPNSLVNNSSVRKKKSVESDINKQNELPIQSSISKRKKRRPQSIISSKISTHR